VNLSFAWSYRVERSRNSSPSSSRKSALGETGRDCQRSIIIRDPLSIGKLVQLFKEKLIIVVRRSVYSYVREIVMLGDRTR